MVDICELVGTLTIQGVRICRCCGLGHNNDSGGDIFITVGVCEFSSSRLGRRQLASIPITTRAIVGQGGSNHSLGDPVV